MSKYIIPVLFVLIFAFAVIKKVKPYDAFTQGAKSAMPFAVSVFPYLVSIFVLTELFETSGLSNFVSYIISPFFSLLGILASLMLVSAILNNLQDSFGKKSISTATRFSCYVYLTAASASASMNINA